MGDFYEHVLFGFSFALLLAYFVGDLVSFSFIEAFMFFSLVFIGSILPDVDHKNSYVHRASKSFLSIFSAVLVFVFLPLAVDMAFVVSSLVLVFVYLGFSTLDFSHRGFTHSIVFGLIVCSLTVIFSSLYLQSFLAGIGSFLGVLSHLILDGELKLK
ncbi:MAG: metal-dependent hydrolase [Candidatus Nanohaloarchaea archaeon]